MLHRDMAEEMKCSMLSTSLPLQKKKKRVNHPKPNHHDLWKSEKLDSLKFYIVIMMHIEEVGLLIEYTELQILWWDLMTKKMI